jgi:serine/threonine protein kinase
MFLDEARIAARLNYPNVIQTVEVGQVDEEYYLAMEYLEGQPLSRIISTSAYGMTPGMHLSIISEALNGLHYPRAQRLRRHAAERGSPRRDPAQRVRDVHGPGQSHGLRRREGGGAHRGDEVRRDQG